MSYPTLLKQQIYNVENSSCRTKRNRAPPRIVCVRCVMGLRGMTRNFAHLQAGMSVSNKARDSKY